MSLWSARRAELACLVKRGGRPATKKPLHSAFSSSETLLLSLKQRKRAVGDNISLLGGGEQRAVRFSVVGIHGADFKRPIFCSMRRSFSSPLQFLPMSAPVFTSHFVPISVGTPSSFAAYCSSNSGDAEAMTIGRSRGLSKNHLPSLARVASACQKSSASVSKLKRLAISPKSTLLNCVRLRLPAASRSDVPRNFGRPARTPGWRRRQNRVKSTVESPS